MLAVLMFLIQPALVEPTEFEQNLDNYYPPMACYSRMPFTRPPDALLFDESGGPGGRV
jgi:hypothetical protein